jgi:hypothetical protein
MAPHEEDLFDEEPPAIEPYTILCISKNATSDEVKSAYRKAALRHHPGMLSAWRYLLSFAQVNTRCAIASPGASADKITLQTKPLHTSRMKLIPNFKQLLLHMLYSLILSDGSATT